MRGIFIILLSSWLTPSHACSFMQPVRVSFDEDIVVQVTPFRHSGLRGRPVTVGVLDAGRSPEQMSVSAYHLYSYSAQAAMASLLAVVVLRRRQSRQGVALGLVRWTGLYLVVLISCLTCIVGLAAASWAFGFQNDKWLMQLFWIVSALTAYLIGGRTVSRLRRA